MYITDFTDIIPHLSYDNKLLALLLLTLLMVFIMNLQQIGWQVLVDTLSTEAHIDVRKIAIPEQLMFL